MGFLNKIASAAGGSIVGDIINGIKSYFPPDMSPEKMAEIENKIREAELKKLELILATAADAEKTLNQRIAEQEGTAKDLKQMPILGRIVLFLRGLQRPAWGFFTMYLDFNWFTTSPAYTEQQQTALIVVNVLVLGFLFGERTVKNLEPLIIKVFGKEK